MAKGSDKIAFDFIYLQIPNRFENNKKQAVTFITLQINYMTRYHTHHIVTQQISPPNFIDKMRPDINTNGVGRLAVKANASSPGSIPVNSLTR